MGQVVAEATVSLDGYVAGPNESGFGVFVVGRRLFDLTDGWGGRYPFDKPIVAIAGDPNVSVSPGKLANQCLKLGLLDEISIDLVISRASHGLEGIGQRWRFRYAAALERGTPAHDLRIARA